MKNSKIEWCDHTFNPWMGCTKVSPACDHCYAEVSGPARVHRARGVEMWGPHGQRVRTSDANWRQPLRWDERACWFVQCDECGWRGEAVGAICGACQSDHTTPVRPRVFCASLADVFDNSVDREWRDDLATLILSTPNLDWLLLTKRIGNAAGMQGDMFLDGPPDNIWLGATICNQEEADRDIPKLLATPAARRFLSVEPLLGPVKLRWEWASGGAPLGGGPQVNLTRPWEAPAPTPRIDWIIVGGESGHQARAAHPDWVRSLRDQCQAAGVPFFFKQWGEFMPPESRHATYPAKDWRDVLDATGATRPVRFRGDAVLKSSRNVVRVGKRTAGRLLDGREWNEVPA